MICKIKKIFFLAILIFLSWNLGIVKAVAKSKLLQDSTIHRKSSLIPLPLIYYTPEANWGFGGAVVYAFRFAKEPMHTRPSQIRAGFAYTLNQQLLSYLSFQLFRKSEKYKFYGELGYYRYSYQFSGIGNEGLRNTPEYYHVNYPRVRLNALYQLRAKVYLGLRYWMDDFNIVKRETTGLLIQDQITGSAGGFLSGIGLVANIDTRDNIFFPARGKFIELVLFHNGRFLGSDFNFSKLYLDYNQFWTNALGHTIALNIYGEFTSGDPPFNGLSLLGGSRKMRGHLKGRYRDKQYIAWQMEYRLNLFWRLGFTSFAGAGLVANKLEALNGENIRYSYGAGLRLMLSKKEKINLRFDVGFGRESSGFYITVGEAF